MEQVAFEQVFFLGLIVVLLALGVLLSKESTRNLIQRAGQAVAVRFARPAHSSEWEIEQAELWLMARRRQLRQDLVRVERLMLTDHGMSATRQLGNRLARDQLLADLRRIPDLLPGHDRFAVVDPSPFTRPQASDRIGPRPAMASTSTVEVLEVGGWSRR
ncbi:MAG: hypothetical protein L0H41_16060 [Microlunatus sp.]|nr:hypothetical protein [Microlunatus sp.]MDN5772079.1 hypothetical protein [Microlunatus sp.]